MTLQAIVHSAEEGGFWAEVPSLPGCATEGETLEEVRANLLEAVEAWLEAGSPEKPVKPGDQILELAV
jgi:predicted RNase H-like HicB family nuclease